MKNIFFYFGYCFLCTTSFGQGNSVQTITRYDLPKLTRAQEDRWILAQFQQAGVIGSDFNGKYEIGTAPAERKDNLVGSSFLDVWFPNTRPSDNRRAYKQTMIGKISSASHYENTVIFPDFDINFHVIPNTPYKFLIEESPRPNLNYKTFLGQIPGVFTGDLPNCPTVFKEVEAEIDLKDIHEKQFTAFFNDEIKDNRDVGFYGTWIYDRGHCDQPEIHPAEQFWWSRKTENVFTYRCNLVCDYSKRFLSRNQYDSNDGKYTIKTPWAEPPVKGVFAIPFAMKPGVEKVVYKVIQHAAYNLNANNSISFDPYKVHNFVLNGQTIVSVIEPEFESLNVSFADVGYNQTGDMILGFVVLTSAVGKYTTEQTKEPGHLFFEVKKSILSLNKAVPIPGKIKVTMEAIECTSVDDYDDTEDIFGLVLCKGFAVSDTIAFNPTKLPFKSGSGPSGCPFGEEVLWCLKCPLLLSFKKGQKSTFGSYLVYDFPVDGYLEITGNLDESDSDNCTDFDQLGVPQKKIILTNEIGVQPYRFTQFFASGKTMMKIHYKVEKIQ